jgi:hypothetical protein
MPEDLQLSPSLSFQVDTDRDCTHMRFIMLSEPKVVRGDRSRCVANLLISDLAGLSLDGLSQPRGEFANQDVHTLDGELGTLNSRFRCANLLLGPDAQHRSALLPFLREPPLRRSAFIVQTLERDLDRSGAVIRWPMARPRDRAHSGNSPRRFIPAMMICRATGLVGRRNPASVGDRAARPAARICSACLAERSSASWCALSVAVRICQSRSPSPDRCPHESRRPGLPAAGLWGTVAGGAGGRLPTGAGLPNNSAKYKGRATIEVSSIFNSKVMLGARFTKSSSTLATHPRSKSGDGRPGLDLTRCGRSSRASRRDRLYAGAQQKSHARSEVPPDRLQKPRALRRVQQTTARYARQRSRSTGRA